MLPHVDSKVQEIYRRNMRGILNDVAKPYNEFAKYIFTKDAILNNKNFKSNIARIFKEEMDKKRIGFGYEVKEGQLVKKYEHFQRD